MNSPYPKSVKAGIPRLGRQPAGWLRSSFGEILEVVQRPAILKDDEEYQLVTARRSREGITPRGTAKGADIAVKSQFYVHSGDFLISKRQIVHGGCGIVPAELEGAIVSNEYSVLRNRENLVMDYLRHFSHTLYFQQTCFHSSIGVHVEKMLFKLDHWFEWPVYLPPLPEQRKIAQILSTWDEAIALVEALIAALKRRKQGLMQRLLTGEVRFPGFEGEWQEVRLGEICERITKGSTPTTYGYSYVDQGINFIAVESVSETGKFLVEKFRHITEENHQVFSRSQLENGDVLISIAGALGRTAIVRSDILPANTNQALAIVRLRDADDTLRQYVRYSLGSQQIAQRIMQITSQSAQPNLNLADISQLPLNMPSHSETMQIVTILTESESAIDLLDEYRMVIREQKRGLMQRLLTGEVRVNI